jgi:AcrR family transcriptional regulator
MRATSTAVPPHGGRKLRADAQRNYDRIVAVAREMFAEHGANASLDEIAKRAGVGPGTLYRHFPSRADLHLAVLQDWISGVEAERNRLAALDDPAQALDEWLHRYVEYKNFWRGLHVALLEVSSAEERPALSFCKGLLSQTSAEVIDRAKRAGLVRPDVEPSTIMQMVSGIAFVVDQVPAGSVDVDAQLNVIKAGIRPAA